MKFTISTKKSLPKGITALAILVDTHGFASNDFPANVKKVLTFAKKTKTLSGKRNEILVVPQPGKKIEWLIIVGIGELRTINAEMIIKSVSIAVRSAKEHNISSFALHVPQNLIKKMNEKEIGTYIAEGCLLGDYAYTKYLKKKKSTSLSSIAIISNSLWDTVELTKGLRVGKIIGESVNVTREYGNAPSNEVTPQVLAELSRAVGRTTKQKVTILNQKQMAKEKMGGILGVTSGSVHEAQFIIMEHMRGKKNEAPIVLVGKGITFDSGGISIKPSQAMDEMKYDMSGGGAVIGTMRALGELNIPINVIALVPATENVPSGTSYKPGDILTYADGTTVEVMNTDAEGRLVLADALIYARKFKPRAIIDIATLTGAIVVGLGDAATAIFSNDQSLTDDLIRAGDKGGERMWAMPIPEEYSDRVKSKFADLRNTSSVPGGGALTAAAFLQAFVKKGTPWAHLDIAGTAWKMNASNDSAVGATGVGIRTLITFLREL